MPLALLLYGCMSTHVGSCGRCIYVVVWLNVFVCLCVYGCFYLINASCIKEERICKCVYLQFLFVRAYFVDIVLYLSE